MHQIVPRSLLDAFWFTSSQPSTWHLVL